MKKLLTTLTIILIVLIVGCKKDDYVEVIGVCPTVVSTNPINASTDAPINQVITATFNEQMNPATFTQASFTVQQVTPVTGTAYNKGTIQIEAVASGTTATYTTISGIISYAGTTVSFTPSSVLNPNTTYTATLTSAVKDLKGNALQTNYVWNFTTGTTVARVPTVILTDPLSNATGVAINKTITATFSVPMDPSTLTTSVTLKQGTTSVLGVVSYAGSIVSFKPSSNLLSGTIYTARITTAAKSLAGISLAKDTVWTFTTGTVIAPTVISTNPLNNATNVVLNQVITANFSVPMDPLTLTNTTFKIQQGSTTVLGTILYTGTTVTFTPNNNLLSGSNYTATITTGAKSLNGTPLVNNYVWNFSTKAPLGPAVVDLKSVAAFGIIAGVGVSNDAGFSVINNLNVGIYPGVRSSITGFPPAIIVNGAMYASDDIAPAGVPAMLLQAKNDLTAAYLFAQAAVLPAPATVSGNQGGLTLAPGIYKSTSSLSIQGSSLTLDAQGDVNAVWIFQIASSLTTTTGGSVILIGGAQAKNVFWQVGSSATIGDGTSFVGNILALTSITMNSGATAQGRMLVQNGAVVLTSTNIINTP
jgi:hypothetical protein